MPPILAAGATRPRRVARVTAAVGLGLAAMVAAPALVEAIPSGDPRAEREQVQVEAAEVAAELDALQADAKDVEKALRLVNALVKSEQARLADAQRAAVKAEEVADAARAGEADVVTEIEGLEGDLSESAVEAYINPSALEDSRLAESTDLAEAALRAALIELRSGQSTDVLDRLAAARADLEVERQGAEAAEIEAAARRAEAQARQDKVKAALEEQKRLAQKIEERINHASAEAVNLADRDAELADEIAAEQAALAAALPPGVVAAGPAVQIGPVSVTTVGGITVNVSVAGRVQAMLQAAGADGVALSGSGYRDSSRQIELRRQNCGSSQYAIYQMPSSYCSPPTARPGTSMHEQGLAIDFANCSYGSASYNWLSGNAARFGFYNLPSESWHWSTTGS